MPLPTIGLHCPTCRGVRLHSVRAVREQDGDHAGRVTRQAFCGTCAGPQPIPSDKTPGVHCPACRHVFLKCLYVNHRASRTVRVKQCRHCGHKIRTAERVESTTA